MSSFSKIYYSPKNSAISLSVRWEIGYKNIEVYDQDRLVHTIPNPVVLMDGIQIVDEELGKIKFQFTTERPRKLEIKVNGKKFVTINNKQLEYDYTGVRIIFYSLSVFALGGCALSTNLKGFDLSNGIVLTFFLLDIAVILTYGLIGFLLRKKIAAAYFIGTSLFAFMTGLAIMELGNFQFIGIYKYFILTVRLGMLTFLILQGKHIINEMKKGQVPGGSDELLDDFTKA